MSKPTRPERTRTSDFTDDPDLKLLHEQFDYATDAWADIRDEAVVDMRCVGGDVWDPNDRQQREKAGRPCLSLDEFGQYVNQIINDVRQNKRAIKVTPVGNGANDESAELRADLFRQIEYRSNAQQAYTTMFENAVQRSYGYIRVKPRYVSDRSRHQELIIEPIHNPDLVTPDPDAVKPDLADMKYLFLQESWSKPEFKKAFPKASVQDFTSDLMSQASRWIKDERIMLAEWWRIDTTPQKLVFIDVPPPMMPNGQSAGPSEEMDVPAADVRDVLAQFPGAQVVGDRMAEVSTVSMRLTNGVEILKESTWPGKYIPFVSCFGKILYVDEGAGPTRRILSAIRLAISPAMLYSYYRTGEAEQVGMATKFPYFVREGSLSPEEAVKLGKSVHEAVEFIKVRAQHDSLPSGFIPEMPVRNPFEPSIQALEVGAESARRAIQAAMGISPLPTSAQRRNEKSGVALKQIEESAQKGTFHFIDHFEASVTRVAVILDDLLPHYYDAARDLTVRTADDSPVQVRVNDPNQPVPENKDQPYGPNPMIASGDHDVTLSTGPSFDSEREAANDFSDTLVNNLERIAGIAGPEPAKKIFAMAIKLKNIGALGNEMADIISPPQEDKPQIPPEVQQQMQQMQAAMEELQQLADDNKTKMAIAELNAKTDIEKAQITAQTNVVVAEIKAGIADLANQMQILVKVMGIDAEVQAAQRAAERDDLLTQQGQAHEVGRMRMEGQMSQESAEQQHAQAQEMAAMQHAQAREMGEASHAQSLELGAQPPPLDPNALGMPPTEGEG